jgi:hypothetical protein
VSIGLAWVNTDLAKYCWLLLALVPNLAARLTRPPASSAAGGPGASS